MEAIYFLLIVVTLMSGAFFVLRKINTRSYLFGSVNEANEYRKKPVQKPEQPLESRREHKYVDWYLENGHKRQDLKLTAGTVSEPSCMVGVAFIANDFSQYKRASNN